MDHKKTTCTQQSPADELPAVLDRKEAQFLSAHIEWCSSTPCRQKSDVTFDGCASHDLQKPPFGCRVFVWVARKGEWAPAVRAVLLIFIGYVYRFLCFLYCTGKKNLPRRSFLCAQSMGRRRQEGKSRSHRHVQSFYFQTHSLTL